jgi:putative pyruvate formate lyase activating enzyme
MHPYTHNEAALLEKCTLCPRQCGVNRFEGALGYCRSDASFAVSSVCAHHGEEPVISGSKGICNVFFPHCNLQCIYCQNADISVNTSGLHHRLASLGDIVDAICRTLDATENVVGFVSPSHYIPQMLAIIRGVRQTGRNPVFVYNTNGYDDVETLKMLEGVVDIYLTDFKYTDASLAFEYSHARNYPEVAAKALLEMYRQKGSSLIVNDDGMALSGIIVRHLVLPGAAEQSVEVLKFLADEISPKLHISVMAQYFPTNLVAHHPLLRRTVLRVEYEKVVDAFHELGFYRGWVQDLESHAGFRPDFSKENLF